MHSPVLPSPEKLNGTKSCELAAILVTLGFTRVDDAMKIVQGDGIPGGRLGYWRFLPQHPRGCYKLDIVLHNGTDPMQARHAAGYGRKPVYMEQAYMAAAMHNKRLLVESIKLGTRLTLEKCGYLYVFRRVEAAAVPEMAAPELVRGLMAAGTQRTELAAALATLGFEPTPVSTGGNHAAEGRTRVTHEGGGITWLLPSTSADGQWSLRERMSRWQDDAWCAQPDNKDPIACIADCFWNLGHLRKAQECARNILVRVANGGRSVLMPAEASDTEWNRAGRFLKGLS